MFFFELLEIKNMWNMEANNSGDLVEIKEKKSSKIVFHGHLLGQNSKVIIGINLSFLNNPAEHICSNFDQIKHLNQADFEDNLDTWLGANPEYVSFTARDHTVTVLEPNTTEFKASIINDIYDFKRNKWGSTAAGAIPITDNPMAPCNNVIIECIGSENIYLIINGLKCSLKRSNLNGVGYPNKTNIGRYNFVQDPNNQELLNLELVEAYDATFRDRLISPESRQN